MKILVLNPFNIDPDVHSLSTGFATVGESMTVQSDVAQSDINNIVKQFGLTGQLPYGNLQPFYDDITDFPVDYHEAKNFMLATDEAFMLLPAEQRSYFKNDAGAFLDFVENPANYDQAIELGLVPPRPIPAEPAPQGNGEEASD